MGLSTDAAEALLLLMNSTPVVRGEQVDLLDEAGLQQVLTGLGVHEPASLEDMRAVRGLLQRLVHGRAEMEEAQRWLLPVVRAPRLTAEGLTWELRGEGGSTAPAAAVLEWARLGRDAPGRLKACGNPDCAKYLLDRSRAGTAQWCSMAECGNRLKARRHAARAAAGS